MESRTPIRIVMTVIGLLGLTVMASQPLFAALPTSDTVLVHGGTISISAAPETSGGNHFCFEVSTGSKHKPSITCEVNNVELSSEVRRGAEPGTYLVCVDVPPGTAGAVMTLTAVGSSGDVATATVQITN